MKDVKVGERQERIDRGKCLAGLGWRMISGRSDFVYGVEDHRTEGGSRREEKKLWIGVVRCERRGLEGQLMGVFSARTYPVRCGCRWHVTFFSSDFFCYIVSRGRRSGGVCAFRAQG